VSREAKEDPTGKTAAASVEVGDRAPIGLCVNGRYRVVSELGAGAGGNVCLAEDEATGHEIALRFLPRGLSGVPRAAQEKQRRSIVSASTIHPALVRVLKFGEAENGHAFVAMELVQGRRLNEILSQGPLEVDAALRLALDLGGSVEILHKMGLTHGALRPCNVMVLKDGRVKLMDLELIGLRDAKVVKGFVAAEPPAEYLSPEQIRRVPVTEKADIYSFGVLLYEMLCGAPPFQAETRDGILAKHLTGTPAPIRRQRRAIPAAVEAVVALALYKQPDLRPPMHNVLNRLWAEAHAPAIRRKRTARIVGGAAVAASIAALVGWGLFTPRPAEPPPPAQSTPPAAARAAVGTASPPRTPPTEGRTAPPPGPAARAAGRAEAARATPPSAGQSSAAPPPKADPREQSRARQAPAGPARDQRAASSEEEAYDSGAVIDWLLRSSKRGQ
jgi:serine/threonine protein kinase